MTDDSTRLAVLIDADNTSPKLIKEMFEELASYGTITVKRAYGDWTNPHLTGWREVLLGNAISPQQQFAYTTGKNATDSALIIDAMDLLYSGNVEGSRSSPATATSPRSPPGSASRASGSSASGSARRRRPSSRRARGSCSSRSCGGESVATEQATEPAKDDQPRPIQSVLTKALNKVDTDDEDWASLSALGNHLNRTDPSFDSRNYGFGKLSDLVKAQPFVETKTVTAPGGRGNLWVRLKGRRPVEEASTGKPAKRATKKVPVKKVQVKKAPVKKSTKKTARKAAAKAPGAEGGA